MLLDQQQLGLAVEIQAKSYSLLKWVGQAVDSGLLTFQTAHKYSTLPQAATDWIEKHFLNIPAAARVDRDNIPVFANFFSTYLENSFELVANPGRIRYSPDAHCFCPMCSWMIDAPRLKTKAVSAADKKRAGRMQVRAVWQLGIDVGANPTVTLAEEIVAENGEATALLAYGHDLIERLDAAAHGPAILALWRKFAWSSSGSPKPKFRLSTKLIIDAESHLQALFLNN